MKRKFKYILGILLLLVGGFLLYQRRDYFFLESTFKENINNKGQVKEYLIGKFYDMEDKVQNIVIKPDYEKELLECDIGTVVELDIKDVAERKFAVDLKFIDKRIKKVA